MYLTEGDLEKFILQDIDSSFSSFITDVISQVTDYINNYCGVNFENSTAETRYFDTQGGNELVVGDFQSITKVEVLNTDGAVDATLVKDTDYFEYPYNNSVKSMLKLSMAGQYSLWPKRTRAVKITGTFGHSSVPAAVKVAAIKLAAKIINEGLRGGQVASESLGSYNISYKTIDEAVDSLGIKEILNQYRAIGL